jgi:hypothetical protein
MYMRDASMLEATRKEGQADWPALLYQLNFQE